MRCAALPASALTEGAVCRAPGRPARVGARAESRARFRARADFLSRRARELRVLKTGERLRWRATACGLSVSPARGA